MNSRIGRIDRRGILGILIVVMALHITACHRSPVSEESVDVVLIGAGIMSATLASMLKELDDDMNVAVFERLPDVALESSAAWNNAGTGHAAFSELNYTPEAADGSISLKRAIEVSEAFEVSKQYWAYLVQKGVLKPQAFINNVPHLSFVWGDDNVRFLKKRFDAMSKHPFFVGMEYTEDRAQIKEWAPLLMAGRNGEEKVAATRMVGGVDVDFGALTAGLLGGLKDAKNFSLNLFHEVKDISRNNDMTWSILVSDRTTKVTKLVRAQFVFIGAGGGALPLLQKSGIEEADGFGGFPIGGAWLVSTREDLNNLHQAKVYGKAATGSPPMSVPHLDTRFIDGKRALLFGPFATFSTKFLKSGSWSDLLMSVSVSNIVPMMEVGINNIDLVRYLIGQVLLSKEKQIASLREYFPDANIEDWHYVTAGQRVQVIKKDPAKGGVLQFGTELVSSQDKSLVALLGASPGASTAVMTMIEVLESSFAEKLKTKAWQDKIKTMIPSYGYKLADDGKLIASVREKNRQVLALEN